MDLENWSIILIKSLNNLMYLFFTTCISCYLLIDSFTCLLFVQVDDSSGDSASEICYVNIIHSPYYTLFVCTHSYNDQKSDFKDIVSLFIELLDTSIPCRPEDHLHHMKI